MVERLRGNVHHRADMFLILVRIREENDGHLSDLAVIGSSPAGRAAGAVRRHL